MSCEFEDDLTAYVDGELPEPRRAQVEVHLRTCAECRPVEALLRRTVAQLAALPALEPSPGMRRQVLARLDAEPEGWVFRLRALLRPSVLVPSFAVAAALGLAVVFTQDALPRLDDADAEQVELAANLEVVEDLDVLGAVSPEDLEIVEHLHELEATP